MLDTRWQFANSIKQTLVGDLAADLVKLALRTAVGQQDPLFGSKVREQTVVLEGDVDTVATNEHALVGVRRLADTVHLVVDKQLEEEKVKVTTSSDVVEDGCTHKVVRVGTEAVDEVVVVEHVDHGDLCDGLSKGSTAEPLAVVVEHVAIDAGANLVGERHSHAFLCIALVVPLLHLGLPHERIAVDLVATTDDGVVWLSSMRLEQIVPERVGAVELSLVDTRAETIAAVTSPSEVVRLGGNEEGVASHALDGFGLRIGVRFAVNRVVNRQLAIGQGNLNFEAPKGKRALLTLVLVELDGLRVVVRVGFGDGGGTIGSRRDTGSILPSILKGGGEIVVTGGIFGDNHGVGMVNTCAKIDVIVSEHRPRFDVERRHLFERVGDSDGPGGESERRSRGQLNF